MAITSQSVPGAALAALNDSPSWPEIEESAGLAAVVSAGYEMVRLPPHPLYYLGLSDAVAAESLQGASLTGWRHLVEDRGGTWAIFTERVIDQSFRFAQKHRLEALENRLSDMNTLNSIVPANENYGLRALSAPPLMNLGIWLFAAAQPNNLIIPVQCCVRGLDPGGVFTERRFLELALVPARMLLSFTPRRIVR